MKGTRNMTEAEKAQQLIKVDRLIDRYHAEPNILAALWKYREELIPRLTAWQRVRRFFGVS